MAEIIDLFTKKESKKAVYINLKLFLLCDVTKSLDK